ncbi:hypothetical protein [Actinocatenispora rupis]|uniref:Uncharacterized protein n=1 Tax=Actinocatenispora rupis TaxID=519421 RepID=A0A8J3J8Z9_9ACTN|nr:hypothetical protein [Actinocatenispora rupis]GID10533.1 hypothetical protein Aru02nite_14220 [Actinocatenispora rupis]
MWTPTPIVTGLVSLGLIILFVATCVSLMRMSVYVRTGGRRYAIETPDDDDALDDDDDEPVRYRPRRRPRL